MGKMGKIFLATAFTDFTGKPRYFATNEHELTQIFNREVREETRRFFRRRLRKKFLVLSFKFLVKEKFNE